MRPNPGEMQATYWRFGRVDLAKGPNGWWLTVWVCRPPAHTVRYRSLIDRWLFGFVRIVRHVEVLANPPA